MVQSMCSSHTPPTLSSNPVTWPLAPCQQVLLVSGQYNIEQDMLIGFNCILTFDLIRPYFIWHFFVDLKR